MKKDLLTLPFPQEQIKTRPGQHGKTLAYVDVAAVIERLNAVSDFEWSFEVVRHEILENEVVVLGKLTIDGVTKMAFGGASVTRDSSGKEVSVADDLKSASSDCTKKCASLFGIGLEVYAGAANGTSGAVPAPPRGGPPELLDRITSRQLAAIHAAARRRGMALPDLAEMLTNKTGKAVAQFLTKREASSVLDELSGQNGTQR
jgi:hypothetical protein